MANIKNKGAVFKVLHHLHDKKKIKLSSLNPAPQYAATEYSPSDFHWIYPVDSITYKIKRR